MITISPWLKITSPPAERMKFLPVGTKEFVIFGVSEKLSVLEEIKIDGKTYPVERVFNAGPGCGVGFRFLFTPEDLAKRELIAVLVAILKKYAHKPYKQ